MNEDPTTYSTSVNDAYAYPVPTSAVVDPTLIMLWTFVLVTITTIIVVACWQLFKKAGKPGWASIVPFYSSWVMVEIAKLSVVWFVLLFVPVVNIVALVVIYNGLSKAFGKGWGTTILMLFFPYVMFPYLAFSKNVAYAYGADGMLAPANFGVSPQIPVSSQDQTPSSVPPTPPAAPPSTPIA